MYRPLYEGLMPRLQVWTAAWIYAYFIILHMGQKNINQNIVFKEKWVSAGIQTKESCLHVSSIAIFSSFISRFLVSLTFVLISNSFNTTRHSYPNARGHLFLQTVAHSQTKCSWGCPFQYFLTACFIFISIAFQSRAVLSSHNAISLFFTN